MRNKYKNLQNRGQSQTDNSYIKTEKINHLNANHKSNDINKYSFVSNFDNTEKVEKMINPINDKEKKPLVEKRHAASFISNNQNNYLRGSNHNILYSVYKRENKDNSNIKDNKETNIKNNVKNDNVSSKYNNNNINKNIKINLANNKDNKENKINNYRLSIKIDNQRETNNKRQSSNNNYNSKNTEKNNNNTNIINKSLRLNNIDSNYNSGNIKTNNNISINININNRRDKSQQIEKDNDYKRIKWDVKEQKLKIQNKYTITNYNSTTNINIPNRNKIENAIAENNTNTKRLNYIKIRQKEKDKDKGKEKENKTMIKIEEKEYKTNAQSKKDIFSDKIKRKFTYRSKRASEELENKEKEKIINNTKDENKNKVLDNIKLKEVDIKKFDNEKNENNNKVSRVIGIGRYRKELTRTPNIINTNNNENEPKTEEGTSRKKFRRFFHFRADKNKGVEEIITKDILDKDNNNKNNDVNKENKDNDTNKDTKKKYNEKENLRKYSTNVVNNKDNLDDVNRFKNDEEETKKKEIIKKEVINKEVINEDNIKNEIKKNEVIEKDNNINEKNKENKIEENQHIKVKKENFLNKENFKNEVINKDNKGNENNKENKIDENKNIKVNKENYLSPIVTLSPIPHIATTDSNASPDTNINSPQPQSTFRRINTHMYKMSPKQTFKEIIHEVNLNKDFHESFTNIFQSCKNDINNKMNSQDLNKSFSSFSNSNNELKLNLDINGNTSQFLKVNLIGKKSSDINNYKSNIKLEKVYSPSSTLIYKKKMNLIKSISNQYKKSIPNFIFNSINSINNKRNSELSYGNIINNNTYNTTLNIFTEKKPEKNSKVYNINNISRIEHKKHIRTSSGIQQNKQPFYSQIFYPNKDKEKEKNIIININNNEDDSAIHKKNKSIRTCPDLSEMISKNDLNYKINFEILYIVESKLQNILLKINNYIICPNECFDLITYYFSSKFYEKEINIFKNEQNKKNISNYIKLELLCYFLCYDVCFNKSFSQTGILLKTIFNLLHNNYLILVHYIISEAEKSLEDNLINNEYSSKLKNIIKNTLKVILSKQNLDENILMNLIGNTLKQVSNYYKMIIDNLYSHFCMKKNSKKNYSDIKYKFPQCLQLDIDNLDFYEKANIISLFFFDSYNKILNNHNFEDMKYFFDSFLQRIKYNQIKEKPKSKSKNKQNKLLSSSSTTKNLKNLVIYKYNYNGGFYYLPPMKKYYKYTLVLDLDETLVYLMPNNIYLTEDGKISETRHTLIFRPGLIEFLKKMKCIYELVIFSFGTLAYVDSVIKIIEKNEKFFEHVLYRQHATVNNGEYIKDLSLLGRNLKNILIVDDISQVFKLQEKNGICIKAFYGDIVTDRNTLKILGKILEKVRFDADEDGDIRKSLEKQRSIILSHITNNSD